MMKHLCLTERVGIGLGVDIKAECFSRRRGSNMLGTRQLEIGDLAIQHDLRPMFMY